VTPPGTARQFVKLLPIAFVPSGHANYIYVSLNPLDARSTQKVHRVFIARGAPSKRAADSALFIYCTMDPARHFPCLVFQTRYEANCFEKRFERDWGNVVVSGYRGTLFSFTKCQAGNNLPKTTHGA
jgi:hypothetical protein